MLEIRRILRVRALVPAALAVTEAGGHAWTCWMRRQPHTPLHGRLGVPWGAGHIPPLPPTEGHVMPPGPRKRTNRWYIHFPGISWWIGEVFILFLMNDAQCKSGGITYMSVAVELFIGEKITRDQPKESAISN